MNKYSFSKTEQQHLESSMIPFAIFQAINDKVCTIALSAGFCRLFGYDDISKAYQAMDTDMYKNVHKNDTARLIEASFRFATENVAYDVTFRVKEKSGGRYRVIHAQGEHIYTHAGDRLARIWYNDKGLYNEESGSDSLFDSFGELTPSDESFTKASYYDHLTGLPGMTRFFELASACRSNILSSCSKPSLLYMDFCGMKHFNHKYGFSQGDRLLQDFSRLIADSFGSECCCRIGQDHFAVITCAEGIEQRLEKLFEQTEKINGGQSLPLHIGIYADWAESVAVSTACDMAKSACNTLRNRYASYFSFYDMKMQDDENKQQYIIANIDKAISEKWIAVYYQPIVRSMNGKVCNEEALARWFDPDRGIMSPEEFIPVLEEHSLIYKLDLYVVECIIKKLTLFKEAGLTLMPQSVNLSRSDFDSCDIVEEVRRRIDDAGISRSLLTIEITESIIAQDFEYIRSQTDRFRALGFAVWMDDFGSGYSSLDVLHDIRFDLIKFDMRFMRQVSEGTRGRVILTEMLKMAATLGVETICEGVETEEQVKYLQETGCTKLQGFYFDKPNSVEQIF